MNLYTFFFDYIGGTYISQVEALSPEESLIKWAENLDINGIKGINKKNKSILIKELKNDNPVKLNDLISIWCTTVVINEKLGLINFVETIKK